MQEKNNNNDLVYMSTKDGINFSIKLLWMLNWFKNRYEVEYFLRLDDDYFLCLDRLLLELPQRQQHGLYWGYIHCEKSAVRVDESFLMLSKDIVWNILERMSSTLQCYQYDAVALWIKESGLNITYFSDNFRVHYKGLDVVSSSALLCEDYLGIHNTYPDYMRQYWDIESRKLERRSLRYKTPPEINRFSSVCEHQVFDYKLVNEAFEESPTLCKDNLVFRLMIEKTQMKV